jgi:hypothetical protein
MASSKIKRSVSMQCSTCGGTPFEHEAATGPFRCVGCDRTFEREELLRENGRLIDSEVAEMTTDVAKYARDELRKAFAGSKNFKLK